jgi:ribosomal protein S8E
MTDYEVKPRSTGHDITRRKSEETVERVNYAKMTQTLFVEIISLIKIPRKNQLMKEGQVVEQ